MGSERAEPRAASGRLQTAAWLLITSLFGLPLITPLLRWSAVACTHDGHLHYHRVAAMAHAWENGIYLTRWLPDLAFGYGYPFFVYREAAPLYAVLLPHLAGLPLPAASNLFYALTILLCGVFMFLWVRDLFGPRAALVSAVAYMAAPYVLVDALVRGNSPESLALPLFPLLLWAGRRWVLRGSVGAFVAGVAGLALLSLGHNISTLIFAPTLLVYLVALVVSRHDGPGEAFGGFSRRAGLARAAALLVLGLGVAFFYTGGALLEMDQVTLEMSTTTRNNDWRNNFATMGEILGPVAPENPALVNPPLLFRLGWVPLLLAAAGLSGLLWLRGVDGRAREQRLHIWLMFVATLAYLFMALPLSRPLWEALPLIDFVQFPWRFVGRAALPVAFLAGVPFFWLDRYRAASTVARFLPALAAAAAAVLLVVEALPNLYPRFCYEEPFPTILTVHAYEHATGLVGVDPEGSYFPRTVRERPSGSPLEADYAAGRTPQRFDLTALPVGAAVENVAYGRAGVLLTLHSPEPFAARYLSFAFPGWTARVDGQPVDISAEDPSGLITFAVPAGTHEITVGWGTTPLRAALVGLSILSAVTAIGVAVWGRRYPPALVRRQPDPATRPRREEWLALALVGLGLLGLKLVSDRVEWPLRNTNSPPVTHAAALQGGELRLDGFNLSRDRVPAGELFEIDMAWTAVAAATLDYQTEIALIGPDGLAWSRKGTERPRVYEDAPRTRLWSPGEWGWDSREVVTLAGAPPGIYDIVLTLFDRETLAPVTLVDTAAGQALGPAAALGQVTITNPPDAPDFAPQFTANQTFPALGLRLLGYNQDRDAAAPGESVLLNFFWECFDAPCEEVTLRLEDEAGSVVETWRLPAIREGFERAEWPAHGRLRGQHPVQLPAGLAGGNYRFTLEEFPLGEIVVTSLERYFEPPPLAHDIVASFTTAEGAPVAALVGIAADSGRPSCLSPQQPGGMCELALVWQANAVTTTSYRVFVHLVDAAGNIVSQSDGIPAGWTRPATGWLPGEFVTDNHTLTLPENLPDGPLAVRVGLYDPATGERLTAGGADFHSIQPAAEPTRQ